MLEKRILEVIKNSLEIKVDRDLVPEDNIEDLGINSISYMDVIIGLEDEFNIEIDDDRLFFPKGKKLEYIIKLIMDTMA
jgi:acyl carrier protein